MILFTDRAGHVAIPYSRLLVVEMTTRKRWKLVLLLSLLVTLCFLLVLAMWLVFVAASGTIAFDV
jgi:hypothetical protein